MTANPLNLNGGIFASSSPYLPISKSAAPDSGQNQQHPIAGGIGLTSAIGHIAPPIGSKFLPDGKPNHLCRHLQDILPPPSEFSLRAYPVPD